MTDQSTQGVLELHPKGYGFLRSPTRHYVAQQADPYVPAPLVHKHQLREGMLLGGPIEAARKGSGPKLMRVEQIEGIKHAVEQADRCEFASDKRVRSIFGRCI